jgi:hypothetical protein
MLSVLLSIAILILFRAISVKGLMIGQAIRNTRDHALDAAAEAGINNVEARVAEKRDL